MDKIKIGIPRGIHYYYFGNFWKYFFEKCNIELIYSPKTTQELVDRGSAIAPDEMCLSMKIYLGHLSYLEGKCDYVLIPRIDRFDKNNQTCTNFLAIYDLAHHYFQTPILNYNIDTHHDLLDGLLELRDLLGISKMELIKAYEYAKEKERQIKEQQEKEQYQKMSEDGKKVLVVSHAYNIHDDFIGGPLEKLLEDNHIIPLLL